MDLLEHFKQIKTFVFDLDGVLTDGSLLIMPDQQFIRTMNIKDGYALQLAVKKGYEIVIISGSNSGPCKERLEYLGIKHIYMGIKDKTAVLTEFLKAHDLKWEQTLYMGDDLPDFEVMKHTGLPCCPADAVPEIQQISAYISESAGGKGCAREVIEKVLKLNRHWNEAGSQIAAL